MGAQQKVTALMPSDGQPAYLLKDKVVLAALDNGVPAQVETRMAANLPGKCKKTLWHIGKQDSDKVTYGVDGDVFKFPCCDVGGLTNCSQGMSLPIHF